jgi:hypothetical protein
VTDIKRVLVESFKFLIRQTQKKYIIAQRNCCFGAVCPPDLMPVEIEFGELRKVLKIESFEMCNFKYREKSSGTLCSIVFHISLKTC